jgi:hypothetical protein
MTVEGGFMEINSFDKGVIGPDRIILSHIFFNALGK